MSGRRSWSRWSTGEEVLQLRALQLSDRWAAAVQRATRPLAKPVQIVGVLGVRAAANTNRNAALSTSGHGARTARHEGCGSNTVPSKPG